MTSTTTNHLRSQDGSETTSDSFDFSLADGGEDGAAPVTGTFSITVTPVNDATTIATNTGTTVAEGSTGNTDHDSHAQRR